MGAAVSAVVASHAGNHTYMQYFVRAMEKHEESSKTFGPETPCSGLDAAKAEAKRMVSSSDPSLRLLADVCARNGGTVRTKYRCWINERGEFQESILF